MRLGILKTGAPPEALQERFGDYPAMMRQLLGQEAHDYVEFAVDAGRLPASPEACQAYLVTGSSAGVYEDLPWIEPLKDFLRQARGRSRLVGICFGHQIMAEAFGGQVIKSPKGWGVGLHAYEVLAAEPWMEGDGPVALAASHQDQVVRPPAGARVLGARAFTPYAMLDYGDGAISMQPHPEFAPDYARALIEARRGSRYSDGQADAAVASYEAPDDRQRVGRWISNFLEGSSATA
ncbi:glutamine amidotransferase-related protein [Phenylobacterium sp.]|uniref:glutamine amidotransferase-related protein n=1 Tax=Phenylobacterium sp. TaxID=1871053 RepID=UPI002FDAFAED